MSEPAAAVYKAIVAVQAALAKSGIAKDRQNQQQGYAFRGIDDVYAALAPLLAEHQLCILPRVLSRTVIEHQTKAGGTLFSVVVEVEFDFVAASDGTKHTVKTFGEAMDSADKATNKAMSAAYKYACLQTFCIPTEGDNDADAHMPDVAPKKQPAAATATATRTSAPAQGVCPIHGKPWRQGKNGLFCPLKLQDGSWCTARPQAPAQAPPPADDELPF